MNVISQIISSLLLLSFVSGQIQVLSPLAASSQFDKNGTLQTPNGIIPAATSTFGAPTYGESFIGRIIRFPIDGTNYCDGEQAYEPYSDYMKKLSSSSTSDPRTVFLIDRGGCSFMEKAFQAEKYGADAAIFIDNKYSDWDRSTLRNVIVADNGHGIHVNIPSVIVTYEDGQGLLKFAEHAGRDDPVPLIVEFKWEFPQNDVAKIDFWMSSSMDEARQFISQIAPMVYKMGTKLMLVPHFYVVELDVLDQKSRQVMCYDSDEAYCVPSSANDSVPGASILYEDIRQLCLLEVGKQSTIQKEHLWMEYVSVMLKDCPTLADQNCGQHVLRKIGGTKLVDTVEQCMENKAQVKKLLENEKNSKAWAPMAIRINEARYNGNLDPILVMKAVCAGFPLKHRPSHCADFSHPVQNVGTGIGLKSYVLYLFVILAGFYFMKKHYLYDDEALRRSLREDILAEVKARISSYQSANDEVMKSPTPGTVELGLRKVA